MDKFFDYMVQILCGLLVVCIIGVIASCAMTYRAERVEHAASIGARNHTVITGDSVSSSSDTPINK